MSEHLDLELFVHNNTRYFIRYTDYIKVRKTNEEIYEGNIRSDFSTVKRQYTKAEVFKEYIHEQD